MFDKIEKLVLCSCTGLHRVLFEVIEVDSIYKHLPIWNSFNCIDFNSHYCISLTFNSDVQYLSQGAFREKPLKE